MAASERDEDAGSRQYQDHHMNTIFKEGFSFSGYERDLLVMNLGTGKFFDISGVSGIDSISDGRGSVFADFDNDGDLDIFLTTAQREAHYLFRNNVGSENRFIRVSLNGTSAGRDAFGAVVRVKSSSGIQTKIKTGGAGYLSQNDPRLLFGIGSDEQAEWIEVVWPGGKTTKIDSVRAGSSIRLVEGTERHTMVAENRFRLVDPLTPEQTLMAALGFRKGARFPNLRINSAAGEARELHGVIKPGRKTLVNFWATWCGPCAKEMPELQRLYPALARSGIDLLGVSVDLDTAEHVPEYLRSKKIDYPVYTTGEETLETLYPRGEAKVPLTVLLDEKGRVADVYSGWSARSERAIEALVGG